MRCVLALHERGRRPIRQLPQLNDSTSENDKEKSQNIHEKITKQHATRGVKVQLTRLTKDEIARALNGDISKWITSPKITS